MVQPMGRLMTRPRPKEQSTGLPTGRLKAGGIAHENAHDSARRTFGSPWCRLWDWDSRDPMA